MCVSLQYTCYNVEVVCVSIRRTDFYFGFSLSLSGCKFILFIAGSEEVLLICFRALFYINAFNRMEINLLS